MIKNQWRKKSPEDFSNDGEISFIISEKEDNDTLFEVKKSSECIPQWWKNLDNEFKSPMFEKDLTLKACIPFTDIIMAGYMFVLKHDIYVSYDEEKHEIKITSDLKKIEHSFSWHPKEQIETFPFSEELFDGLAFKWMVPYTIKTPKDYSVIFTHPLNQPYLPFYTLAAMVDTDTYFMPINFPFIMKKNYNGIIPKGTPIVQIIPVKRRSWKFKVYNKNVENFRKKVEILKANYNASRYVKNGKLLGGVYKRKYRVRKDY